MENSSTGVLKSGFQESSYTSLYESSDRIPIFLLKSNVKFNYSQLKHASLLFRFVCMSWVICFILFAGMILHTTYHELIFGATFKEKS